MRSLIFGPIATAPKDRLILIGWVEDGVWKVCCASWEPKFSASWDPMKHDTVWSGAWTDYSVADWGSEKYVEYHPTAWRDLPQPHDPVDPTVFAVLVDFLGIAVRSLEAEWFKVLNNRPGLSDHQLAQLKREPVVADLLDKIECGRALIAQTEGLR